MRKPVFFICEKQRRRSAAQLPAAKIRNFKPVTIFCGCTARFVSDLIGNPKDRFSHNVAQIPLVDYWPGFWSLSCEQKQKLTVKFLNFRTQETLL